jgi:hypothetical protein
MSRLSAKQRAKREDLLAKGLKKCPKCGQVLPLLAFTVDESRWDRLKPICRSCHSSVIGGTRQKPGRKLQRMVTDARTRARHAGLPFDLTLEWLLGVLNKSDYTCERTGMPFIFTSAAASEGPYSSPWAPTLDQIAPGGGYTEDNTQVVCIMYNTAKNVFTDRDVLAFASALHHHTRPDR